MLNIYIDFPIYRKKKGSLWSHMFCQNLDVLHEFAKAIGIKRCYFEKSNSGIFHYDVKKEFVNLAISKGAIQLPTKEILKILS